MSGCVELLCQVALNSVTNQVEKKLAFREYVCFICNNLRVDLPASILTFGVTEQYISSLMIELVHVSVVIV